jgi:2-polyprenyl-6-methoxyphenol hydroxylase-like FAD-dependent oxidoreductase
MSGHKVRVLERGPRLDKPSGGIRLQPNVTKILAQWGLEEELIKRASPVCGGTNIWDCKPFAGHLARPPLSPCHFTNHSLRRDR